jgi:hypothetical protein
MLAHLDRARGEFWNHSLSIFGKETKHSALRMSEAVERGHVDGSE